MNNTPDDAIVNNECRCAIKGCITFGNYRPVICVPTEGRKDPARIQLGIRICSRCREASRTALKELSEEQRTRMVAVLKAANRGAAQWDDVKVEFIRWNSTEARKMDKARSRGRLVTR